MTVIKILVILIDIAMFLYALASGFFSILPFFRKEEQLHSDHKQYRYAVLIPARNEENVITDLLESLKNQNYPSELIDIRVLINDCSDHTAKIAEEYGAEILECGNQMHTKGEVLRYAFEQYKDDTDTDAYIIFDADNIVDQDFVSRCNSLYSSGAKVIQGKRCGVDTQDSVVSGFYRIYYALQNGQYNASRRKAGLSASINGSGWLVDKKLIDTEGFECVTIVEDFEYTILCDLNDTMIYYCQTAVTKDEFPDDLITSIRQRVRWSKGIIENIIRYVPSLFKKALRGSLSSFDVLLVTISCLAIALTFPVLAVNYIFVANYMKLSTWLLMVSALLWVGFVVAAFLAIIENKDPLKKNLKSIILFPIFILTWMIAFILSLFQKGHNWTPIEHRHTV